MFVLSRMVDSVRILPNFFDMDFHKALIFELNKKFANKVVLNVGLCICFYDFEKVEDSYILPGDGASHTKVTMGIFDDIVVPADKLPHPSHFQESDQLWVWKYDTGEEGADPVSLYMEPGSEIRFRVAEERFTDTQPSLATGHQSSETTAGSSADDQDNKQPPYMIFGNMSEPGLGCLQWWTS